MTKKRFAKWTCGETVVNNDGQRFRIAFVFSGLRKRDGQGSWGGGDRIRDTVYDSCPLGGGNETTNESCILPVALISTVVCDCQGYYRSNRYCLNNTDDDEVPSFLLVRKEGKRDEFE